MKENTKLTVTAIIVFFLSPFLFHACSDEKTRPILDPTGNWSLTVIFGVGDCDFIEPTDSMTWDFSITKKNGGGYLISDGDPGSKTKGQINCSPDECKLSATDNRFEPETADTVGSSQTIAINAVMNQARTVSGDGSVYVKFWADDFETECSQQFTLTGKVSGGK